MRANEVRKILGITQQTLYNWTKRGKIKYTELSKGYNDYDETSVYSIVGNRKQKKGRKTISYSRVSTQNQKEQLKGQTQRIYDSCISRGIVLDEQIEDIKSGMSSDRKGFQKLIQLVIQNGVELVVIENKDRLIRFGYDTLESIFNYFGTKILVLNEVLENKTYEEELTEDLISTINYFTMKSHSQRIKLNKIRKELE